MALQSIAGGFIPIGPRMGSTTPESGVADFVLNLTNQSAIFIGRIVTADGASHTIDTSGSSSLGFRTGSVTFANGGSVANVGLAAVDTSAGPAPRASNTAGATNFDVKAAFTGGGGGITGDAWNTCVPTSGAKTVANGDLVAFVVEMTTRAGADAIRVAVTSTSSSYWSRPAVTKFDGGSYSLQSSSLPICVITFSDGALGWIDGGDNASVLTTRTWNSGSATKEYGQLYQMPFPMKVCGIYGIAALGNDADVVLYSDPTGTPVAEKTVSIDANTIGSASTRVFCELFPAPYTVAANQPIAVAYKPGGSNISSYFKTINSAAYRVVDPWGTSGYGVSRASGAFANANSSLDHYYIGLLVSAFDDAASVGGGAGIGIIGS